MTESQPTAERIFINLLSYFVSIAIIAGNPRVTILDGQLKSEHQPHAFKLGLSLAGKNPNTLHKIYILLDHQNGFNLNYLDTTIVSSNSQLQELLANNMLTLNCLDDELREQFNECVDDPEFDLETIIVLPEGPLNAIPQRIEGTMCENIISLTYANAASEVETVVGCWEPRIWSTEELIHKGTIAAYLQRGMRAETVNLFLNKGYISKTHYKIDERGEVTTTRIEH